MEKQNNSIKSVEYKGVTYNLYDLVQVKSDLNEVWNIQFLYEDTVMKNGVIINSLDSLENRTCTLEDLHKLSPIGISHFNKNPIFSERKYYILTNENVLDGPFKIESIDPNIKYFEDKEEYREYKKYTDKILSIKDLEEMDFKTKEDLIELLTINLTS